MKHSSIQSVVFKMTSERAKMKSNIVSLILISRFINSFTENYSCFNYSQLQFFKKGVVKKDSLLKKKTAKKK